MRKCKKYLDSEQLYFIQNEHKYTSANIVAVEG